MPSILVETGFVDNREEEEYLDSEKGVLETAQSILNGIKKYKAELEGRTEQPVLAAPVKSLPNPSWEGAQKNRDIL